MLKLLKQKLFVHGCGVNLSGTLLDQVLEAVYSLPRMGLLKLILNFRRKDAALPDLRKGSKEIIMPNYWMSRSTADGFVRTIIEATATDRGLSSIW